MTIAKRLKSRLWYLNLFVKFSLLSYFNMYDSWNNYHIILIALAFPKNGLRFLCFQYYRRYKEFGSDLNFVKQKQNCRNLNEILYMSGNIESTKNADHILEMAGPGEFYFRNLLLKLGWQINAANYIKNQDDIQVVLHTVMFRGTLCILCFQFIY